MFRMNRRSLLAALPAAAILPAAAHAQGAFPDRPVRYIVPFPPGGLTDIMARLVGQKLSEIWNRPVIIENRAGGNALIGADAAAKSAPDGYTLLAITMTHTVNATLFPNAPFNFRQDLTTVSVLGSLPLVVVVNAEKNPSRTLADLITRARTERMNAGSSGNGSPPHLGLELLRIAARAGDNLQHVPYRGGAPVITDLVAGNIDFVVANLPECIAQVQAGRLRPLAITSAERHALLPDVPTVKEARPAGARDDELDGDDGAGRRCPRRSSRRSRRTRSPPSATPRCHAARARVASRSRRGTVHGPMPSSRRRPRAGRG